MSEKNTTSISDKTQMGQRIKLARIAKGFKQYELAKNVGVTRNYISLLENGKKNPSLEKIRLIAKNLDISIDSLVGDNQLTRDLLEITSKYDIAALIKGLEQIQKDNMS